MIIHWPGRSRGRIVKNVVRRTDNGFLQFVGTVKCTVSKAEGQDWEELEQPSTIDFFLMLTGSKGINSHQRQSLMDALGWDGRSLAHLQSDLSAIEVSVIHAIEKNNRGEDVVRVQWINPVGFSAQKADEKTLADLQEQFDSGLKLLPDALPSPTQTAVAKSAEDEGPF